MNTSPAMIFVRHEFGNSAIVLSIQLTVNNIILLEKIARNGHIAIVMSSFSISNERECPWPFSLVIACHRKRIKCAHCRSESRRAALNGSQDNATPRHNGRRVRLTHASILCHVRTVAPMTIKREKIVMHFTMYVTCMYLRLTCWSRRIWTAKLHN